MKKNNYSYTFSFDIFDTCLIRTCGNPANVFTILGRRILGEHTATSKINDFSLIRKNSETNARKALISSNKEEITIQDIYNFCDFSTLTTIDKSTIIQKELEIEDEVLLPIHKTREKIDNLHKAGHSVIYISDMYLPKSFIISILKKHNFYVNDNIVYISSDINKTKQSGHLFDYIHNKLGLSFKKWIHEGDNKTSDYLIPQKKGIKAHLRQYPFSYYEIMCKRRIFVDNKGEIDYIFSLCHALRLSMDNSPQNEFATTFVAPIFVPYVYSVMDNAKNKGIKNLFFIARDGYILYQIAKIFSPLFPNIGIHYLYASRKSLYLPGLDTINYNNIKDIVPLDKGIDGILYTLNIQDFNYLNIDFNGLDNNQCLYKLCQNPDFIEAVKKSHKYQETLCLKYFKQEGLDIQGCAIVDVLGSRRCQKYMNNILKRNGLPEVFAYYFEVTWNRISCHDSYTALNYQESFLHYPIYHHVSQPLYEQFFAITDQERTIGYKEENGIIIPIKEKDPINNEYKKKIFEANKNVCLSFAFHFRNNPIATSVICIRIAQYAFGEFCHNPQKKLLKVFDGFYCSDGNQKYPLIVNKPLIHIIINRKHFFRWLEGNIVYNSGCLYKIIRLLLSIRLKRKIN